MPKSDFRNLHPLLQTYVIEAIEDSGRRPQAALEHITDNMFDELVAEAYNFYRSIRSEVTNRDDFVKLAKDFFKERNEEEDLTRELDPDNLVLEGVWENPDLYGNYRACRLTDAARRRGPHRLEQKEDGSYEITRTKRQ